MSTSPTARTLAYCRKRGWHAGVVEKWNPHAKVRHDLFGCFDLIVVTPRVGMFGGSIIGVQACAGASHAPRVAKVRAAKVLPDWIAAHCRAEVWSWTKRGERGKAKRWTLRTEVVLPEPAT